MNRPQYNDCFFHFLKFSDSEVAQSFENLVTNYLGMVAPARLVPVQIRFFSQLAATFLARYNEEKQVSNYFNSCYQVPSLDLRKDGS